MPELPEVETILKGIKKELIGKKISKAEVLFRGIVKTPVRTFQGELAGAVIRGASRRSKFLLMELDKPFVVLIHLKMTGQLLYSRERRKTPHTHLILHFSDGTFLHYLDIRKFGAWWLYPREGLARVKELKKVGEEPLGPAMNWDRFNELLDGKKGKLKPLLMDQTFICGMGNIYSDEILYRARIHPLRQLQTLKPLERKELFHAMKTKLEEGIRRGGCSMDTYLNLTGGKGTMQEHLLVYGRKEGKCLRCGTGIKTLRLSGRTGHFCPYCQRLT